MARWAMPFAGRSPDLSDHQLDVPVARLEQAAFWRRLFDDSANTLHLLTLWTREAPAPFIDRAVQRIGTVDTVPTDNWSGGGISAPVALASGTLGEGRMHPLKASPEWRAQRFSHHPDSGAAIAGAVLPGWERVREVVFAGGSEHAIQSDGGVGRAGRCDWGVGDPGGE
jgi:hypothetical protein